MENGQRGVSTFRPQLQMSSAQDWVDCGAPQPTHRGLDLQTPGQRLAATGESLKADAVGLELGTGNGDAPPLAFQALQRPWACPVFRGGQPQDTLTTVRRVRLAWAAGR